MPKLLTKKDNIEYLWNQLQNNGSKKKFMKACSLEFDRSYNTIKQHWFSSYGDWSVPEDKQDQVIKMLQIEIKNQNS